MDNNDPNKPNQNTPGLPSQPTQNPWDLPAAPASDFNTTEITDPMSAPTAPPSPVAETPWPSSTNTADPTTGMTSQSPMPQAPTENQPNQFASNPFMQPQSAPPPTDPSIFSAPTPPPSADLSQFGTPEALPDNPMAIPPAPETAFPSVPAQSPQQDPLNTAFSPIPNPNEANPFGPPSIPEGTTPTAPIAPVQPNAPSLNPTPTPDFLNPSLQNPVADIAGGTGLPSETPNPAPPQSENPQIPGSGQPGTLDLSSLQNNQPATPAEGVPSQPATSLPEMGPVENAPTDLSHLIAGDETTQQPGDIYNPPIAADHNPALNTTQPQLPSEDGAPPTEKHLNLTKVLLIAGIPIILIVAALSAYLILGIGKSSPSTDNQTSLPIERTAPAQGSLTNPPQPISIPSSPAVVSQPSPTSSSASVSTATGSATLPGSSSSPTSALEKLRARQSTSPSPTP